VIRQLQANAVAPARVVVLGASGFVGGDLVKHLHAQGIPALGLSSKDVDLTQEAAVGQLECLTKPTDVLVFASTITPDRGKDVRTLMKNLSMGEHVASYLEKYPCAHLVYISSDAVYDEKTALVNEETPCNPTSFHGVMHLTRERMMQAATAKAKVPCVILRPTLLYGAADTHNGYGPNRFVRLAVKGETIKLFGQGEEKRDHVYIRDVSRIVGECILHRCDGVLNVATGKSASFHEVAELVGQLCGRGVHIEGQPRATPITHRHFDITLALRSFPGMSYTTLREGLTACLGVSDRKAAA
jgi:nucleoside-diphosphate-sugar epimerase